MDAEQKDILRKIQSGEIDINASEIFISKVLKGFMWSINRSVKVRGEHVTHVIAGTGDSTLYEGVKGQDNSIEPLGVSNEDYVYSKIPRAVITTSGVSMMTDQLTSAYASGDLTVDWDGMALGLTGEFRRIPLSISVSVKYVLDSFNDSLSVTQDLISKLAFINTYSISYIGQSIGCTYRLPDSIDSELQLEFDGLSVDSKTKTVSVDCEIETNMPVFKPGAVMFRDSYIRDYKQSISFK